jgi:hypothetical protein
MFGYLLKSMTTCNIMEKIDEFIDLKRNQRNFVEGERLWMFNQRNLWEFERTFVLMG